MLISGVLCALLSIARTTPHIYLEVLDRLGLDGLVSVWLREKLEVGQSHCPDGCPLQEFQTKPKERSRALNIYPGLLGLLGLLFSGHSGVFAEKIEASMDHVNVSLMTTQTSPLYFLGYAFLTGSTIPHPCIAVPKAAQRPDVLLCFCCMWYISCCGLLRTDVFRVVQASR